MSHPTDQAAARLNFALKERIWLASIRQPYTFPFAPAAAAKRLRRHILSPFIDRPTSEASSSSGAISAPTGHEQPAADASITESMADDVVRSILLLMEGRNLPNKAGVVCDPILNERTFRMLSDLFEARDLERRLLSLSACLIFLGDVLVMTNYPRRDEVAEELVDGLRAICGFFGLNDLAATLRAYVGNHDDYNHVNMTIASLNRAVAALTRELLIMNLREHPLYLSRFGDRTVTCNDIPRERHAFHGPHAGLESMFPFEIFNSTRK